MIYHYHSLFYLHIPAFLPICLSIYSSIKQLPYYRKNLKYTGFPNFQGAFPYTGSFIHCKYLKSHCKRDEWLALDHITKITASHSICIFTTKGNAGTLLGIIIDMGQESVICLYWISLPNILQIEMTREYKKAFSTICQKDTLKHLKVGRILKGLLQQYSSSPSPMQSSCVVW